MRCVVSVRSNPSLAQIYSCMQIRCSRQRRRATASARAWKCCFPSLLCYRVIQLYLQAPHLSYGAAASPQRLPLPQAKPDFVAGGSAAAHPTKPLLQRHGRCGKLWAHVGSYQGSRLLQRFSFGGSTSKTPVAEEQQVLWSQEFMCQRHFHFCFILF